MNRYSLIILIIIIAFIPDKSFAQLSIDQEKRLEDLEEKARVLETWEQEKSSQEQKILRTYHCQPWSKWRKWKSFLHNRMNKKPENAAHAV